MTPTERAIAALPPHLRRFVVAQEYEAYTPRDHAVWRHVLRQAHRAPRRAGAPSLPRRARGDRHRRRAHPEPRRDEPEARAGRAGPRWRSAASSRPRSSPSSRAGGCSPSPRTSARTSTSSTRRRRTSCTRAPATRRSSPTRPTPSTCSALRRGGVPRHRLGGGPGGLRGDPEPLGREGGPGRDARRRPRSPRSGSRPPPRASGTRRSRRARAGCTGGRRSTGSSGALEAPRLYGAGLLSSIGEAVHCLTPAVRKLPLTAACADVAYDITRMQPQLFVARDFDQLFEVLEEFAATLSWRRGGDHGLEEARRARTVNHLVLSGGRELSGQGGGARRAGGRGGARARAPPSRGSRGRCWSRAAAAPRGGPGRARWWSRSGAARCRSAARSRWRSPSRPRARRGSRWAAARWCSLRGALGGPAARAAVVGAPVPLRGSPLRRGRSGRPGRLGPLVRRALVVRGRGGRGPRPRAQGGRAPGRALAALYAEVRRLRESGAPPPERARARWREVCGGVPGRVAAPRRARGARRPLARRRRAGPGVARARRRGHPDGHGGRLAGPPQERHEGDHRRAHEAGQRTAGRGPRARRRRRLGPRGGRRRGDSAAPTRRSRRASTGGRPRVARASCSGTSRSGACSIPDPRADCRRATSWSGSSAVRIRCRARAAPWASGICAATDSTPSVESRSATATCPSAGGSSPSTRSRSIAPSACSACCSSPRPSSRRRGSSPSR